MSAILWCFAWGSDDAPFHPLFLLVFGRLLCSVVVLLCSADLIKEECRRVRAHLREAESRCRGLQDHVEEARSRERRISGDAEDARRRAAADAGGLCLYMSSRWLV